MKTLYFLTSATLASAASIVPRPDPGWYSPRPYPPVASTLPYETLLRLTTNFWDSFIYPNNVEQHLAINSTLFSEDIVGRVDASRTYHGNELNTEYVYSSFATLGTNSSMVSLLGFPISHKMLNFATNGNVVSVAELVYFNISLVDKLVPVEIDLWLEYNLQEKIIAYDATFRYLPWLFDDLLKLVGEKLSSEGNTMSPAATLEAGLIHQVCETASNYCTGENQQYDDKSQCAEYLSQNVRLGVSYEFGRNTILCRSLHQLMVPLRPDVHCSHIGPTGGEMCVDDTDYAAVVESVVVDGTVPAT